MTSHYDVEDRGAGKGKGVMGGAESCIWIGRTDTRIDESVGAAAVGIVGGGGGLRDRDRSRRRRRRTIAGDVGDESIGGAEEPSESAGVVLM